MVIRSYSCARRGGWAVSAQLRRQPQRGRRESEERVFRTLFIELVLRRIIDECASLSKIWRAEALLYNSCGLNNSAMKSRVNMARTTSCRTVHGRAPPRETFADCRGESRFEERHLLGEAYAPFTDLSPGIFWAFSRCRRAGSTQRWQRRPMGAKHHASVPQCGLGATLRGIGERTWSRI